MDSVTAKIPPTLSSERLVPPLGRRADVCRTFAAPTRDAFETGRLGGDTDLPHAGARPRLVLQMVGTLSSRRRQRPARPLARTQSQPPGDVGRVAPGRSQASRPADAAAWATRTLSPGGCAHHSSGIGMLGLRTAAVAAHHRARVAGGRAHLARLSAPAASRIQRLPALAADSQQSTPSTGLDRAALLEGFAAPMVFSGLSRRVRPCSLRRISAQTQ